MKLTDVKVGEEYAALDSPSSGYRRSTSIARQVKAVGIEKVFERRRSVRRVRVEFLDGPQKSSAFRWDKIANAEKGTELVVEARQLTAPWVLVSKEMDLARQTEEYRSNREAALQARFDKLGVGRALVIVRAESIQLRAEITLRDHDLELILKLAEAGKENA